MSLTPPTLRFCDDLLSLLLFLDKFEEYSRLGGEIALYPCVYGVVRNRLDERTSWRLESQETLIQALLEAFRSSSIFVLLESICEIDFCSTANG